MKKTIIITTLLIIAICFAASVSNYREQGGDRWVIGGSLDVVSGGDLDIESGGALKIAGTQVTATANELNGKKTVAVKTGDYSVLTTDTGTIFVSDGNSAGAGNVTFTLPTASAGLTYTFVDANATAADDLWITAATGDTINGGKAAKSYKCTGDAVKQSVTITAVDATRWEIVAELGTWANDNN